MKIKNTISAESKVKSSLLMERINMRLKEQGYIITDITSNTVSFKDNDWQIRSKAKIYKKVDKGKFEIFESSDLSRIEYTYYISFLPELMIGTVLVIISFYQSFLILLIILPFLIQFITRFIALKDGSKQLIAEITD
jgi:hypothetical protein